MIVDTSAIVAIITDEPEADRLLAALAGAKSAHMSAATYVECSIVIDRRSGAATRRRFDQLLASLDVAVTALTAEHARLAREAHREFGKGSGSPAGLNLGDCFSYALAAHSGEELLFKGADFAATDILAAAF